MEGNNGSVVFQSFSREIRHNPIPHPIVSAIKTTDSGFILATTTSHSDIIKYFVYLHPQNQAKMQLTQSVRSFSSSSVMATRRTLLSYQHGFLYPTVQEAREF